MSLGKQQFDHVKATYIFEDTSKFDIIQSHYRDPSISLIAAHFKLLVESLSINGRRIQR